MTKTDEIITLHEAADLLGVHYMTAYRYVRTGRLTAEKDGAEWRVRRTDVAIFLAGQADQPPPRSKARTTDWSGRLEDRLVAGDEAGAWLVIENALAAGTAPNEIHTDLIGPALASIGDRWSNDTLDVAHEHQASALTLRLIGRLGPRFNRRGRKRGTVIVASPAGDWHGIPVAMVGDLLRGVGFAVADLGSDVPPASLSRAVSTTSGLIAVGICATTLEREVALRDAVTAVRGANSALHIIVGGAGTVGLDAASLGADYVSISAADFLEAVERAALAALAAKR